MPVSIHRLGDRGMTQPGLNHLRVQVGSDQRRGVEVAQVVEPRSLRQAVCRVGACLAAPAAFEGGADGLPQVIASRGDDLDRTCPDQEMAAIGSRDTSGQGPLTLKRQRADGS
jgi:hypothetical protein